MSYKTWPPEANEPAPKINPRFQAAINRTWGTLSNGWPVVRLVWGQEAGELGPDGTWLMTYLYERKHGQIIAWEDWQGNRYGVKEGPPSNVLVPRPILGTLEIGIPRWFVEKYVSPGEEAEGLGAVSLDQEPQENRYIPFSSDCIAHHDGDCCRVAEAEGQTCYGEDYRDPSDDDVRIIVEAKKRLQSMKSPEKRIAARTKAATARRQKAEHELKERIVKTLGKKHGPTVDLGAR